MTMINLEIPFSVLGEPAMVYLDAPSYSDLRDSCAERIFIDLSACARFTLFSDRWGFRSNLQCRQNEKSLIITANYYEKSRNTLKVSKKLNKQISFQSYQSDPGIYDVRKITAFTTLRNYENIT